MLIPSRLTYETLFILFPFSFYLVILIYNSKSNLILVNQQNYLMICMNYHFSKISQEYSSDFILNSVMKLSTHYYYFLLKSMILRLLMNADIFLLTNGLMMQLTAHFYPLELLDHFILSELDRSMKILI